MAKNKMFQIEKTVVAVFKDISNGDYSIIHNKKSKRKELRYKNEIIFSDISSQICKNVAFSQYGVNNDWKVL
jgi:hypothetical protein